MTRIPAILRAHIWCALSTKRPGHPSLGLPLHFSAQGHGRLPRVLGFWAVLAVCAVFWSGCGSSTDTMQRKLDVIAGEDLQDIIKEIPDKAKGSMLAKPYYKVDEYQEFHGDTAIVFQAKAVLVFFYLDPSLDLCQVRKYRYKTSAGLWDRYDVKLMHFPKKYYGVPPQ
ncbi:MAG: hypothetical protein JWO30_2580 [Fibrobacteres bacterium]|nr:hypothetical protein [Fibrobacterota bacterium]